MKVLIVEDEPAIVEIVSLALKIRWPEAKLTTTSRGDKGIELVETEAPDVVILDLGLPDMDGFDVLKQIRLFSTVPILILTVRDEENDIVKGLEWGADEYMTKPFRQLELMARIQALLRRKHILSQEKSLAYGPFRLDLVKRRLAKGKKEISLTNTEGLILGRLMEHAGRVVSLSELAEILWDRDYANAAEAIRVYIRRLRKKIEADPDHPHFIQTEAGSGYTFKKLE